MPSRINSTRLRGDSFAGDSPANRARPESRIVIEIQARIHHGRAEFRVIRGTGGVKRAGRERSHHHVVENLGDRLRSQHDAIFSRRGPRAVRERERAADRVAAENARVAAHRGRGIADRAGSALGVKRFDDRGDGRVEVRAFVGADLGEIRVEDRDSIANHRHVAADDQAGVFCSGIRSALRECGERAVEHVPRGGGDRAVTHSRQIAFLRRR